MNGILITTRNGTFLFPKKIDTVSEIHKIKKKKILLNFPFHCFFVSLVEMEQDAGCHGDS